MERKCEQCGAAVVGRPDKRFCSTACYQRHWYNRPPFPYDRKCRACEKPFTVSERKDANRQYCCQTCAREAARKGSITWQRLHPEKGKEYSRSEKKRKPFVWRDRRREDRAAILDLLGHRCVVCGIDNPLWLHVDYIPTTRNERYRHSRTLKFVRDNEKLFRILCANHHYELSITGRIEGTDIVQ